MRTQLTASLLIFLALGCGSGDTPRASAKGQVTFDGQPLKKGTITFQPMGANAGGSASAEIVDGKYDLPRGRGPGVGQHRVEVLAIRNNGQKRPAFAYPPDYPLEKREMVEGIEQYIPARYNHKSELTADVKAGDQTINFELKP